MNYITYLQHAAIVAAAAAVSALTTYVSGLPLAVAPIITAGLSTLGHYLAGLLNQNA